MSSPYKLVTKIMDDFQNRSATRTALSKLPPLRVLMVLAALSFSAFAETQLDDHLRAIDWPPYQDETVQLMREYLRIDTSNPPGNELAAAGILPPAFRSGWNSEHHLSLRCRASQYLRGHQR